jgi:hypothetical protein
MWERGKYQGKGLVSQLSDLGQCSLACAFKEISINRDKEYGVNVVEERVGGKRASHLEW